MSMAARSLLGAFAALTGRFTGRPQQSDVSLFRRFYHGCLERGIFFAPSAFEAGFTSTAHTEQDVEETIFRAREALAQALG